MTDNTGTSRDIDRARRPRGIWAGVGAAAAIIALASVGGADASARTTDAPQPGDDPSGLGEALAVTYTVLPPGIDDESQLGYPEAACATDLQSWILGS